MRRERGRRHEPADAQRREEQLRRGADVEHAPVAVERLEALDRLAVEAELAVVVVFEDVRVALRRPVEQREPARQREHAAGRETGATASRTRGARRRRRRARRRRGPASSTGTCTSLGAGGARGRARSRCSAAPRARRASPGIDEQARRQVDRLLRAVHDEDLLGRAHDAARARQIAGERLAQLRGAARRLIGEAPHREPARAAAEQPRPGLERQVGVRGLAVAEVVGQELAPRAPRRAPRRDASAMPPPDRRERAAPLLGRRRAGGCGARGRAGRASATKVPERGRAVA